MASGAELVVFGDRANLVSFLPLDPILNAEINGARHSSGGDWGSAAWGEIRVAGGGRALLMHAIVSGGGANDPAKVPHPVYIFHRNISTPRLSDLWTFGIAASATDNARIFKAYPRTYNDWRGYPRLQWQGSYQRA